jgi:hypothetical protein
MNNELFHQRYSELSDEVRAKNKREDRLLEIRLKYFEREKNIRLNILRKEQYQLERTRSSLMEQLNRIHQDKQKQFIQSYFHENTKFESPIVQLSQPELFKTDWEPISSQIQSQLSPSNKPITHKKVIRPHSAG